VTGIARSAFGFFNDPVGFGAAVVPVFELMHIAKRAKKGARLPLAFPDFRGLDAKRVAVGQRPVAAIEQKRQRLVAHLGAVVTRSRFGSSDAAVVGVAQFDARILPDDDRRGCWRRFVQGLFWGFMRADERISAEQVGHLVSPAAVERRVERTPYHPSPAAKTPGRGRCVHGCGHAGARRTALPWGGT
jgi:hypothetical protein